MHPTAAVIRVGVAALCSVLACSRPPPSQGAAPVRVVDAAPTPSRLNVPEIAIECGRGPVPARPGESPEVARTFSLDGVGVATRTIVRVDGTHEPQLVELVPAQRGSLRMAAAAAHTHGALPPESPVPDGTFCTLRVVVEQPVEWRVAWPSAHASLQALMEGLMPLVYPP